MKQIFFLFREISTPETLYWRKRHICLVLFGSRQLLVLPFSHLSSPNLLFSPYTDFPHPPVRFPPTPSNDLINSLSFPILPSPVHLFPFHFLTSSVSLSFSRDPSSSSSRLPFFVFFPNSFHLPFLRPSLSIFV